ncbi:MAG: DUF3604 domain-containing protein, partial [Myxococcota bacterium]
MRRQRLAALLLWLGVVLTAACQNAGAPAENDSSTSSTAAREAPTASVPPSCPQRTSLRRAFFGDLHVHTAASADAYAFETLNGPEEAYAFARGGLITLPGPAGSGTGRSLRLARPLDFAAVTDHAEWFAELPLCTDAASPLGKTEACRAFRGERATSAPPEQIHMQRLFDFLGAARRPPTLCDAAPEACKKARASTWAQMRAAAERWNAPCDFTSFVAYEWSQTDRGINLHRNVIFRSATVPERATSSVEAPSPSELWNALERDCLDAGTGCDVLAIPHNSNLSNGVMFMPRPSEDDSALGQARRRARLEPLLEIYQVKGDSECRNGMHGVVGAVDEFCDFEKIFPLAPAPEDCREGTGEGGMSRQGCISRRNFARYVLAEGMRERQRLGVNPFELGFLAATDTHNAIPGAVSEANYQGALGVTDASIPQRLATVGERPKDWAGQPVPLRDSPGGLAGIWAEQNSRGALFDAMRRRETFGTSGPHIRPRFFGSFDYPGDLCERSDWVTTGYARGVPMGGNLSAPPSAGAAPVFVASATRDPERSGNSLERIQIVKVWLDDEGATRQQVVDIAGGDTGADVDPATCQPRGAGADTLCGVWRDPDFDPERDASYYARVLE